jgi:hypothetical protein
MKFLVLYFFLFFLRLYVCMYVSNEVRFPHWLHFIIYLFSKEQSNILEVFLTYVFHLFSYIEQAYNFLCITCILVQILMLFLRKIQLHFTAILK